MEPEFQVVCDTCLRTEVRGEDESLPHGTCGICGGTWLGPYATTRRFSRREALKVMTSKDYLAQYAAEAAGST